VHEALRGLWAEWDLDWGLWQWFMPTAEGRSPSAAQRTANKVKVISQKRVAVFFPPSSLTTPYFEILTWLTPDGEGNSVLTTK